MATNIIDEKFNQSEALYQAGRYKEAVAVLEELAASSLSHGERMITARTIVSILYHNILHGYPFPNTPEYAMFRKYIAISIGLFDLAETDYQATYLQEELELYHKILEQMEEGLVVQVPRAIQNWQGLWRIRKEQEASKEIDYLMQIFSDLKSIKTHEGAPITITQMSDQVTSYLSRHSFIMYGMFPKNDTRVVNEAKKLAAIPYNNVMVVSEDREYTLYTSRPIDRTDLTPGNYSRPVGKRQSLSVASLTFGLFSITFGWICLGLITGLVAVILGVISLLRIKDHPNSYGGKELAIGGVVTGGIVFSIKLLAFVVGIVTSLLR